MTIIHKFTDLDHLNQYLQDCITQSNMIPLTPQNVQELGETYMMSASFIDAVVQGYLPGYYLYVGSKASFKDAVHPNLPSGLYKRLFSVLKSYDFILEATISRVIVDSKKVTPLVYEQLMLPYNIDNKDLLSQLSDAHSLLSNDNKYYIQYIATLEEQCHLLQQEIQSLREQLIDSKIVTWY